MARSLVLGNGNSLVCFDKYGQLKDFYFPYVGLENHIRESGVHKIGIFVDGFLSWLDNDTWDIAIDYKQETFSSQIIAKNKQLEIELRFSDIVYNEKNVFIRQVEVFNLASRKREVKMFFNQQFSIYGDARKDTAYFDPNKDTLIHYEGRRYFVIAGKNGKQGMDDYSVGIFGDDGKVGTWKDAEDGKLEKNGIEHGSVDSVAGFKMEIGSQKSNVFHFWITVAKTLKEAMELNDYVLKKTPNHLIKSTQDFWSAWVNKSNIDFAGLDSKVVELFKKSLFIIRSHTGNNGSIIASGDSDMPRGGRDTYAYVWPRDAAFVAMSLDEAGYSDISRKFFDFCNETVGEDGYFFHKYRPDKSWGSSWHPWVKDGQKQLAIQEDETALILYALWNHYSKNLDLEFIESIYNSLIKKTADFMCSYVDAKTNLPLGSYDIWEEDFGVATFTASSTYAGLIAAHNFSMLLGKKAEGGKYCSVAEKMKVAIIKNLYNKENSFFYRRAKISEQGKITFDDVLDMSSFIGVFRFGILDTADVRLVKMFKVVEEKLSLKNEIGGIFRYVGDKYFAVNNDNTENPWFITTLWGVQYQIAQAKSSQDFEAIDAGLAWVLRFAQPSGMLSEQLNRNTGEQLSVSPLIWSHAELVITIVQYIKKRKELTDVQKNDIY